MGEVWKAVDTRLDRTVAIKFAKTDFSDRFEREARSIAALNHPHICQLYDVGPNYLVMEFVEGAPLAGPMPVDRAVRLAGQVLDALDAAHRRGITHRDLKPANVLLTKSGVKLLDFGLASHAGPLSNADATLTSALTTKGQIVGTLQYMAPEQLQGGPADTRSDLFSFGCVLYELLSGVKAFDGPSAADVVAGIMDRDPAPLGDAGLDRVIRRCLAKDADQRFQNARDLKAAMLWAVEQPARSERRSSRRPAAAVVVALAVLAVGWAAGRFRNLPPPRPVHSFLLAPAPSSYRCLGDDAGPAALSPDGTRVAFTTTGADGKVALWTQRFDDGAATPIAGAEGATFPFWSPDSRHLGFFADGKLKKVETAGGATTILADAPVSRGGAWNGDDVILFAPRLMSELFRVSASGGPVAQVTRFDSNLHDLSHRWPAFLPDGKHFLYTSRGHGIFVASLDGSTQPRRLLDEPSNSVYSAGFALYARESTLFARPFDLRGLQFSGPAVTVAQSVQAEIDSDRACFSASAGGELLAYQSDRSESQLTWYDRKGNRLGTIGEPGLFRSVDLSPDGAWAAAVTSDAAGGATLWLYDLRLNSRRRFASMEGVNLGVAWSRDSRRLAIATRKAGAYVIYIKDLTARESMLMESTLEVRPTSWNSDGGLVLNIRNAETGWDLDYLPAAGGSKRDQTAILHAEGDEAPASLSPDGKSIVYAHSEPGEVDFHVYVASFPDARDARQVSNDNAAAMRWNPNGKEILFVSHTKLMVADVVSSGGKLQVGSPRTLLEVRTDCNYMSLGSCFDVTPDGNRFLVVDAVGSAAPLAVYQNWTSALKK